MGDSGRVDWERFGRASKAHASEIEELDAWRRSPVSFDVASYPHQMLIQSFSLKFDEIT